VQAGPATTLHAYRLILELLHVNVSLQLSDALLKNDTNYSLRSTRMQTNSRLNRGLFGIKGGSLAAADEPHFTYTEGSGGSSGILNEIVVCTASTQSPCSLSVGLLQNLRELLRTTFSCDGNQSAKRIPLTNDDMFADILTSSAFRSFEFQSCQLQKVDLASLQDMNDRLIFFTNVYNIMTVHASMKMWPGSGLYDRQAFMRASRYNLGGMIFNLLDIEHGVLRASSSNPMIYGPFTAFMGFKDKDPRKSFAMTISKPFVSFALFTACNSSPPLHILREGANIDHDLEKCAAHFLAEYVRIDVDRRTVFLPEIFKIYWQDFGGHRKDIIKLLLIHAPKKLSDTLKAMLKQDKNLPSLVFDNLDWSPTFVI